MASAPSDDMFDEFLSQRGHDMEASSWEDSYNKKQCPECGGLHDSDAVECRICGWSPAR